MSAGKFPLGQIVASQHALAVLPNDEVRRALRRHHAGDWGDVSTYDRAANNHALIEGTRLFSVYHTSASTEFWIITEADRSATTILFPEDY